MRRRFGQVKTDKAEIRGQIVHHEGKKAGKIVFRFSNLQYQQISLTSCFINNNVNKGL